MRLPGIPGGEDGWLRTIVGEQVDRFRPQDLHTETRDGLRFTFGNRAEFERVYADTFERDEYAFAPRSATPHIVDGGAHIGLSVLYHKQRHPGATVVAFEPNPDGFALLRRNVADNGLTGVELVNAALAPEAGTIAFHVPRRGTRRHTWGSTGAPNPWLRRGGYRRIEVPAVRLSERLDRDVDLLKLDIEGMEAAVLDEAGERLSRVRHVIMEFHGIRANPANSLERVLATLGQAGFAVRLKQGPRWVTPDEVERTDPYWLTIVGSRDG